MDNPQLLEGRIADPFAQQNFQALNKYFREQNQLLDFRFYEVVVSAATVGKKIAHGLPYSPLDILVTRVSGPGTVTFRYASFDGTYVVLDTTGACRVRFFVGTYSQDTSNTPLKTTDLQTFSAGVVPTVTFSDATLVNQTVTLPRAADMPGRFTFVKKTDTTTHTVTIVSQDLVDGAASIVLSTSLSRALLYSNGSTYYRMD